VYVQLDSVSSAIAGRTASANQVAKVKLRMSPSYRLQAADLPMSPDDGSRGLQEEATEAA
jgi:hypothetical protein